MADTIKIHKNIKSLLEDYEKEKYLMYNMTPNIDEDDLQFMHAYAKENKVVVKKKMLDTIIQEYKNSCNCSSCTKKFVENLEKALNKTNGIIL